MKEKQPATTTIQPSDFGSLLEKMGDSASILADLYHQDQRGDKTMRVLQAEAAIRDVPMDAGELAGFEKNLVTEAMAAQHAAQSLKKANDPRAEAARQAAICVSQIVRATGSINPGVKAMHDGTVAATAKVLRNLSAVQRDRDSELALLAHVAAVTPSVLPDFVAFLDRKMTARPRRLIESLFGAATAASTVAIGLSMGAASASAADRVPELEPVANVYTQPKIVPEPTNSNKPENIVPLLDTSKSSQVNAAVTSVTPISSEQTTPKVELAPPVEKIPAAPTKPPKSAISVQPTSIEKIIPQEKSAKSMLTGVMMSIDDLGLLPDTAPSQDNAGAGDTIVGSNKAITANTVNDVHDVVEPATQILTPGDDIMTFLPPRSNILPPEIADPSANIDNSGMEEKPGKTIKVKPPEVAVPSETLPPKDPGEGKDSTPAPAPKAPEAPAPAAPKAPEKPTPAPEVGPYQLNDEQNQIIDALNLTGDQKAFLKQATAGAISLQQHGSKINPEVVIAQAILESGWGGSKLTTQAHNYFGMKAGSDWKGKTVVMPTREFENGSWITINATWKAFDSAEDCFAEYAKFIENSPNFKDALDHPDDAQAYVNALLNTDNGQHAYATDPAYTGKILGTVRANHIDQLVDIAHKVQDQKKAADKEAADAAKRAADQAEADKKAKDAKDAAERASNQGPPKFNGEWLPVVPSGTPITAPFGFRGYSNGVEVGHSGVDFGASVGTPFTATVGGKVKLITDDVRGQKFCIDAFNALGKSMDIIRDPIQKQVEITTVIGGHTYVTVYAHLSAFNPALVDGGYIQAGQEVGKTGDSGCSTGPHAHFEVRVDGVPIDPNLLNDDPKWKLLAQGTPAPAEKPQPPKPETVEDKTESIGQRTIDFAHKFDDYGYLWGGGYDGGDPATGQNSRPIADIVAIVSAGTNKGEHIVDCGGLLRASFLGALGVDITALQFNSGEQTVTTPIFTAQDGKQYHFVTVADKSKARAGDVFTRPGHVGFITGTNTQANTYDTFEAIDPNVAIQDNIRPHTERWDDPAQIAMIYRLVPVGVTSASSTVETLPDAAATSEQAASSPDKKATTHQSDVSSLETQDTSVTDKKNEKATDSSETTSQPAQDGLLKVDHTTPAQEASSDTSVADEETVTGNGVDGPSSDKPVSAEVQAAVDSANRVVAMARQATKQAQSAQSLAPAH